MMNTKFRTYLELEQQARQICNNCPCPGHGLLQSQFSVVSEMTQLALSWDDSVRVYVGEPH